VGLSSAPRRFAESNLQLAVIVAVVTVGMVKVAIHQVVDMISVGYRLVAAVHAMSVRPIMSGAVVAWCAFIRIQ
jgi:hypothetical protein